MTKYIVTDPCYIVGNDYIWEQFCKLWFDGKFEEAEAVVSAEVKTPVRIAETGYGDWTNHIYGPGVIENEFFADAGMVCVCELTKGIEDHLVEEYNRVLGAIFEAEELRDVEFDNSDPDWTVVRIGTDKGIIESENPEDEDYENEDYEEDNEEDNED